MKARNTHSLLALLAPCLALGLLAGCAGEPGANGNAPNGPDPTPNAFGNQPEATAPPGEARDIQISAENMRFDPSEITVQPGEDVRLMLINRGDAPHNIEFELPSGEVELAQPVPPGANGTLSFKAPQEPGRYTFYCPVGNHREQGMTGTLIVAEHGAAGTGGTQGTEGAEGSGS